MTMAALKQPHEDIVGTDRSASDLLSLEDRAVEHRDALIAMTRALHSATLVGNPAPIAHRIYVRMTNPAPGDLVIETTRCMYATNDLRAKGFGILLAQRTEWVDTDAEWAAAKEEDPSLTEADRSAESVYYVQYGPSPTDICRWTNCEFLALVGKGRS